MSFAAVLTYNFGYIVVKVADSVSIAKKMNTIGPIPQLRPALCSNVYGTPRRASLQKNLSTKHFAFQSLGINQYRDATTKLLFVLIQRLNLYNCHSGEKVNAKRA